MTFEELKKSISKNDSILSISSKLEPTTWLFRQRITGNGPMEEIVMLLEDGIFAYQVWYGLMKTLTPVELVSVLPNGYFEQGLTFNKVSALLETHCSVELERICFIESISRKNTLKLLGVTPSPELSKEVMNELMSEFKEKGQPALNKKKWFILLNDGAAIYYPENKEKGSNWSLVRCQI